MVRIREARLIVFLLGVWHLACGVGMLHESSVAYITSLSFFVTSLHALGLDGQAYIVVGVSLVGVGSSAILAIALTNHLSLQTRIRLVWPQQIIQIAQFVSILMAAFRGVYPDGYIPIGGGVFIFYDQLGMILLTLYHTLWMVLALWRLESEA